MKVHVKIDDMRCINIYIYFLMIVNTGNAIKEQNAPWTHNDKVTCEDQDLP